MFSLFLLYRIENAAVVGSNQYNLKTLSLCQFWQSDRNENKLSGVSQLLFGPTLINFTFFPHFDPHTLEMGVVSLRVKSDTNPPPRFERTINF